MIGDEEGRSRRSNAASCSWKDRLPLILSSVVYFILLLSMAILGTGYLNFRTIYGLWFISYLLFLFSIFGSDIIKKIERMDPIKLYVGIFLITLIIHLPFLFGEPMMSQDIFRLERRGELLLDGGFPYEDFNVNKPPLYIWLVGLVSLPFGPHHLPFRVAFSIANSFVPVVMLMIHRRYRDLKVNGTSGSRLPVLTWMGGAIAYATCPIVIIETGIAGHFDVVVVIATLLSFYFLVEKRAFFSGLMLGTGFAMKLYPMFIAPVFFLSLERWKDRVQLFIGFFTIPLISSIPILIRDPGLLLEYLQYQFGDWYVGFSIMSLLEGLLSFLSLDPSHSGSIMTALLAGGILIIIVRGLLGNIDRRDQGIEMFLLLILSIMGISLSSAIIFGGSNDVAWIVFGTFALFVSVGFQISAVYIFIHQRKGSSPLFNGFSIRKMFTSAIDVENVPLISSIILVLLIAASVQFHPWYIAWVLPFSLASGNPRWTWPVLLLLGSVQMNYYPPWELGGV